MAKENTLRRETIHKEGDDKREKAVNDATRIADYLVATMRRTNKEIQTAMKEIGIEEKGTTGFLIFGQGGKEN